MTIVKFLRNLPQDIIFYVIIAMVWVVNLFIADAPKAVHPKREPKPVADEVMVSSLG